MKANTQLTRSVFIIFLTAMPINKSLLLLVICFLLCCPCSEVWLNSLTPLMTFFFLLVFSFVVSSLSSHCVFLFLALHRPFPLRHYPFLMIVSSRVAWLNSLTRLMILLPNKRNSVISFAILRDKSKRNNSNSKQHKDKRFGRIRDGRTQSDRKRRKKERKD